MHENEQARSYFPNFVVRTVRNGRVKIFGNIYKCPAEPDSGGRFEGNRYAFGLYWHIVQSDDEYTYQLIDHVQHWGTEAYYKALYHSDALEQAETLHMTAEDDKGQLVLYWASWEQEASQNE